MSSSSAPGRAGIILAFGGSLESGKSAATALDLDGDESTAPVQGENIDAARIEGKPGQRHTVHRLPRLGCVER